MTTPVAPPRLPIPDGLQLSVRFVIGGQDGAVVLGGKAPAGVLQSHAETWRDAFWSAFRLAMTTGVTCTGAVLRTVDGGDESIFEVGPPANATGAVAGPTPVLAVATLVRWNSATGGRTGKGRTFLPGLATASINGDARTYTAAHATQVNSSIASYLGSTALSGVQIQPAILSFRRGAARPITSGSIGSLVGMQRRRMR